MIVLSTTFPNATQTFKTWQDLSSTQLNAYLQYLQALNNGNWAAARQIFTNGGLSNNMLPTANDFNTMCDTILECRALYEADDTSAQGIQDFMQQFSYKGVWNSSNINQYKKFSMVKYNGVNGSYIYIASVDITTSSNPEYDSSLTTSQWLKLCPVSWVNATSNYRGVYNSSTTYYTGDVVLNGTKLNLASVNNDIVTWITLFDFDRVSTVYSATQPTTLPIGGIWFKDLS